MINSALTYVLTAFYILYFVQCIHNIYVFLAWLLSEICGTNRFIVLSNTVFFECKKLVFRGKFPNHLLYSWGKLALDGLELLSN